MGDDRREAHALGPGRSRFSLSLPVLASVLLLRKCEPSVEQEVPVVGHRSLQVRWRRLLRRLEYLNGKKVRTFVQAEHELELSRWTKGQLGPGYVALCGQGKCFEERAIQIDGFGGTLIFPIGSRGARGGARADLLSEEGFDGCVGRAAARRRCGALVLRGSPRRMSGV